MSYEDIYNKLNDIKIEEYVWIIYIGIIMFSFYSNSLEKKYYLFNDLDSKKKYRMTLIIIFSVLLIVYFYFLIDSYDNVKNLKITDNLEKKKLTFYSFIASLLIFLSGLIFLYIAYFDQDLDVEIAFN